ncbi:SDR family oxidoreductase [Streptomyces misionensis]|uniref:SDR family oxidoreductase n=1 Tax=Streptomyces misionensis TaxID=67331 RepID=A0A5C6J2K2_9ACTN|nr:SDR family oxidoreductase [Streptomyces misionensis]
MTGSPYCRKRAPRWPPSSPLPGLTCRHSRKSAPAPAHPRLLRPFAIPAKAETPGDRKVLRQRVKPQFTGPSGRQDRRDPTALQPREGPWGAPVARDRPGRHRFPLPGRVIVRQGPVRPVLKGSPTDGHRLRRPGPRRTAGAAELFAAQEAAVVLMARGESRLAELAGRICSDRGRALAITGDVCRLEDVERAVRGAVETFGQLDEAFNNASFASASAPLHEIGTDVYDRTMEVNVRGVWNCLVQQIPAMLASGGGAVVNTSSVAGVAATGASAAYVAAKHAVIGMAKAAAADYGRQGVRVNALVVGVTRTEMMQQIITTHPSLEGDFMAESVQHRMADPLEIARAAAWLCSDQSSFVTGAAVPVDSGATATA